MGAKLSPVGSAYAVPLNSSMNVTPFVDIMLVLLIIFMVSMPLAVTTHRLDLPPAGKAAVAAPPTIVTLQKDGSLFVGERRVALANIGATVGEAIGGANPQAERVYLRAERGVRYADFMGLMNALKSQGYKKLALVNEDL
jgi:biopolymer transport protein ExbD